MESEEFKDYYEILNVDFDATAKEIDEARLRLVKKFHTDVNKSMNSIKISRINDAYDYLKTPEKRKEYDARWRRHYEVDSINQSINDEDLDKTYQQEEPNQKYDEYYNEEEKPSSNSTYGADFDSEPSYSSNTGESYQETPISSQNNSNEFLWFLLKYWQVTLLVAFILFCLLWTILFGNPYSAPRFQ